MAEYQGHPSWNAWNVSLWINNDEHSYNYAQACVNRASRKWRKPENIARLAAKVFLNGIGRGTRTPDNAVYSYQSVKLALKEFI
jgi:hypothetical protein